MRLVTQKNEKFIIYDDVLPQEDFQEAWQYVQHERYQQPHLAEWMKIWRTSDGVPFGSQDYAWSQRPFGNHMDCISAKLMEVASQHQEMLGDWNEVHFRCYLYPRDTKLSWHNDHSYTAAIVYYTHPKWASTWGGELLVAEMPSQLPEPPKGHPALDHNWENAVLGAYGMGQYITCKPNRLVLMPTGVWHQINRVDADAGDNVRASIVAFFTKEDQQPVLEQQPKIESPKEETHMPTQTLDLSFMKDQVGISR